MKCANCHEEIRVCTCNKSGPWEDLHYVHVTGTMSGQIACGLGDKIPGAMATPEDGAIVPELEIILQNDI